MLRVSCGSSSQKHKLLETWLQRKKNKKQDAHKWVSKAVARQNVHSPIEDRILAPRTNSKRGKAPSRNQEAGTR